MHFFDMSGHIILTMLFFKCNFNICDRLCEKGALHAADDFSEWPFLVLYQKIICIWQKKIFYLRSIFGLW